MGIAPGERWPDGQRKVVDHLNRDILDNRRANLRVGTQHDNCANRGGMFEGARTTNRADAAEVLTLARRGLSTRKIAAELNLAKTTVQRITAAHKSAAERL
jgi:DNA-binding NarL/FixJ family response regulator